MADIFVKEQVCEACGVEVREGAAFCYNCGSNVTPENLPPENNHQSANVISGKFREEVAENEFVAQETEVNLPENDVAVTEIIAKKHVEEPDTTVKDLPEPELKSAASLRRKPKTIQRKRVEVIWEEHENAPNAWFILVAVLLTLFAGGIWYIAMYLR